MAWENVITGYKIEKYKVKDNIPADAIYLYKEQQFVGMYGWAHNLQPHYETVLFYQIPVYKKVNIKRK